MYSQNYEINNIIKKKKHSPLELILDILMILFKGSYRQAENIVNNLKYTQKNILNSYLKHNN